jgi:hypothetical protein
MAQKQRNGLMSWLAFLALAIPAAAAVVQFWPLQPEEGGWWTALWVFLSASLFVFVIWSIRFTLRRKLIKYALALAIVPPLAVFLRWWFSRW